MTFDNLDKSGLTIEKLDLSKHLASLHKAFETQTDAIEGYFLQLESNLDESIARIIGIEQEAITGAFPAKVIESAKQMLQGIEKDGFHTLGLEEINSWKINPEYSLQNIKQQAGYAAEVISTWKENLIAESQGTGIKTVRADDLPELFKRNDQYIDKVRINSAGEIIERIQTKFVGGNGEEWLKKIMSKDFDKYFDGTVDKIECPKNYYDDIKTAISEQRTKLEKQLEHVTSNGKGDVSASLQRRIDKLNQLDNGMLEKSTVSTDEAIYARLHPKAYVAKIFIPDAIKIIAIDGVKSGTLAAGITFTVSTVDNIMDYINGEINAKETALNVLEDTAAAGALGFGTAFITTSVSQMMKGASSKLIQTVGGSCLPAVVVSFTVESYDDISSYAQGKIDGYQLAYNLGENATSIAGSFAGGALAGAALGSVAGPVGTVAGTIAGGVVGCVVTTEIYVTAIELGTQGAEIISQKAVQLANDTIDAVKEYVPEKMDAVKEAFADFFETAKIPFVHVYTA